MRHEHQPANQSPGEEGRCLTILPLFPRWFAIMPRIGGTDSPRHAGLPLPHPHRVRRLQAGRGDLLRGAELGITTDATSLRGAIVTPAQLTEMAPVLAASLGIVVED